MTISEVSTYRSELMGIATLMIFFGHTVFYGQGKIIYGLLNDFVTLGYSGVDIFLFLSGFGLAFSINKNDNRTFYRHRIIRLLPSVVFILVFYCCINTKGINLQWINPLFWFLNYWYIGFCFVSYALFPFIYRYSREKNGYKVIIVALIISMILLLPFIIKHNAQSTAYSCFITRIPIFTLGMLFGMGKCLKLFRNKILLLFLIIGLASLIPYKLNDDLGGNVYFNTYYSVFVFTPPIIAIYCAILKSLENNYIFISKILKWIGKYSLEIYLIQVTIMPRIINKSLKMGFNSFETVMGALLSVIILSMFMKYITSKVKLNKFIK